MGQQVGCVCRGLILELSI
jgi:hypothetical protein